MTKTTKTPAPVKKTPRKKTPRAVQKKLPGFRPGEQIGWHNSRPVYAKAEADGE